MIRVEPAPEPDSFAAAVRQPGARLLAQRAEEQRLGQPVTMLEPYWTRCLGDLMTVYRRICAYSCFHIHPVTGARSVDHFAAKSTDPALAYEWTNYRLVCARLNSRKGVFADVLDPFEIETGWFVLDFISFWVWPNRHLRIDHAAVQATIDRLGLNKPPLPSTRAEDFERYEQGGSWAYLAEFSPFVAAEIERQGWRRPGT